MKLHKATIFLAFISIFFIIFISSSFQSQDIPISELPLEISDIVNQYVFILQNSNTIEKAA